MSLIKNKINSGNGLLKNASLNVIRQAFMLTFSLVTFPYVSRILGDESYGKYSFATTVIEYLLIFSGSASGIYAIREGARLKNDKNRLRAFSSEIFSIGCLFTLIAYFILNGLATFWPKLYDKKVLLYILGVRIIGTTIGVEWIFNIFEDYKNLAIRQFLVQGIGLLLTFMLVHSENDTNLYAVATAVAMSGVNFVNFFISRKYVKYKIVKSLNLKTHLKPILMMLFNSAMVTIYSNSDIIMLGIMKDDSTVGIYSVSVKVYGVVKGVFIAALSVLLPRISMYLGNNEICRLKTVINKTLNVLLVGLIPSIVLLIFYAKTVIGIIAGSDYLKGETSLQLLSIALFFALVGSLLTTNIMIPNRQESIITIIVSVSAISNIVLNFFLIPFGGANSAAFTTVIAELIVCLGAIIYSKEYIDWKNMNRLCMKVFMPTTVMITALLAIKRLKMNYIPEFIIGTVVSCVSYILCLGVIIVLSTAKAKRIH